MKTETIAFRDLQFEDLEGHSEPEPVGIARRAMAGLYSLSNNSFDMEAEVESIHCFKAEQWEYNDYDRILRLAGSTPRARLSFPRVGHVTNSDAVYPEGMGYGPAELHEIRLTVRSHRVDEETTFVTSYLRDVPEPIRRILAYDMDRVLAYLLNDLLSKGLIQVGALEAQPAIEVER